MMLRFLPIPATLLLAATQTCLADEPISTDRPDFVESAMTVGAGHWQIETSTAVDHDNGRDIFTTPTLLRIGLGSRLELRAETDGWSHESHTSGMGDIAAGLKLNTADGSNGGPAMGWLLHADLPTGSNDFRGHGVRPSLRFVAEWELPGSWSAGVMPGVVRQDDGTGHDYFAGILGVVFGYGWNDQFRSFAELALPQIASSDNGGTEASFDFGSAWLINNDLQLDVAGSAGLNHHSPDYSVTVGLSARFGRGSY